MNEEHINKAKRIALVTLFVFIIPFIGTSIFSSLATAAFTAFFPALVVFIGYSLYVIFVEDRFLECLWNNSETAGRYRHWQSSLSAKAEAEAKATPVEKAKYLYKNATYCSPGEDGHTDAINFCKQAFEKIFKPTGDIDIEAFRENSEAIEIAVGISHLLMKIPAHYYKSPAHKPENLLKLEDLLIKISENPKTIEKEGITQLFKLLTSKVLMQKEASTDSTPSPSSTSQAPK